MDNDIEPYTDQAAERLENGFQDACGSLAIDVAEVRESIEHPEAREALEQAQYCINAAKRIWSEGTQK